MNKSSHLSAPSSRRSFGRGSIAHARRGPAPRRPPGPLNPIRFGRSMPRSGSPWPAARPSAGWPSPTRPPGPCSPPSFPPQGSWEKVPPAEIQDMFRRTFTHWGLPQGVHVDNGYPWGTPRDLPTELALWLIGLGLEVIWNPPAQPRENPKVERCQGVAAAWAEPHTCAGPAQLSDHLDRVCQMQCREYPSISGSSRVAAFP